jgi:integrase
MIEKSTGGRYRVRIFHKSAQVSMKTFDRKKDAESWEAAQKLSIQVGSWIDPKVGAVALATLIEKFNRERKGVIRDHSWDTDESNLRLHIPASLARRPLSSITTGDLETMFTAMMRSHARATVRRHRESVSALFAFAVRHEMLRENIVTKVKLAKGNGKKSRAIAPFSEKDRDDLIAEVRATKPQHGDVIEILALTGIRWGELCSLRVFDLLQEPYPAIMVRQSESDGYDPADPKSGKPRRVPLDDRAAEILTARALNKGRNDRLFENARGNKLLAAGLTRSVNWPAIAPGKRLYDLRHTAATLWLQSGIDIATVAAWLGHSNSAITHRTYLHYMKTDSDLSGIARINARAAEKKLETGLAE